MTTSKTFKQGLWIVFILLLIVGACQSVPPDVKGTQTAVAETEPPFMGRKRADFDFLKVGISYEEIVSRVGKEDRDIGFGSYIFQYDLADGSIIYIQFMVSLESVDRAYITYPNGKSEYIIDPK